MMSFKEVQHMRRLLLAMAILAITAGVAFAGPNAGVILSVQGNALGVETEGDVCGAIALPATCEELVTGATPDLGGISWYLAVVVSPAANTPNFNTVVFGLDTFNMADNYISYTGACVTGALEISTAGWPGPGEGTAVSWAPGCLYGYMEPVYYFGTYNYGGMIPLGVHPVQGGVVVDCSADPQEDPFEGFGVMEGANPTCPGSGPEPGACCFGPSCVMLLEVDCIAQGGDWYGGTCEPDNPCPTETPTNETTWGSIKNIYR
jgi:hypothetical protein